MMLRALIPLTALALCGTVAAAQETPDPGPAESPAAIAPPRAPWDTITTQWSERRYKVEAIRFKANDETGTDWWGSDEVMVGTQDAKGSTVTNEFGDIDSGDTHEFDPGVSCIIGVRPGVVVLGESSVCGDAGEPGPFSFKVEMWEKDPYGFPAGFCSELSPGPGQHAGPHCVNDGSGDDFIGWRELVFPIPDLETALPTVGDNLIETVTLIVCREGTDVCGGADFPDYTFTYRTTRLADVRTDFRSQLQNAMERSGITDPDEAIAAGLRSLEAPVDREALNETGDAREAP